MATLLDLPPEILEQILLELDPIDVAAVSQTCVILSTIPYSASSDLFWRKLYLELALDDPRECVNAMGDPILEFNWKRELQRLIRARAIVNNPVCCRPEERTELWRTLLDIASNTVPLSSVTSDLSYNLVWLGVLLRGGSLLEYSLWELSPEERQLRAHFHTLFGLTVADFSPTRLLETRCTVYTLRYYHQANIFGPFMSDHSGRVNWEHVLAIQHVISMHVVPSQLPEEFAREDKFFVGSPMSLPFCNSVMEKGERLGEVDDWAGVEGTWRCSFCFCDHRDLLGAPEILTICSALNGRCSVQ